MKQTIYLTKPIPFLSAGKSTAHTISRKITPITSDKLDKLGVLSCFTVDDVDDTDDVLCVEGLCTSLILKLFIFRQIEFHSRASKELLSLSLRPTLTEI
jgi:hypothetical protein